MLFKMLLIGCSLGLALSSLGQKNQNEKVIANVDESTVSFLPENLKAQKGVATRGMLSSIAGGGISLAAEGIKKLIEMDKKKYTAEYSAALNELYFYNNLSPGASGSPLDPSGIQFNGLKIVRLFSEGAKANDTAVYVSLKLDTDNIYEIINNSNFHLKLNDFKLKSPKCKVPKNKSTINLDIEVSIRSSWMTESGVFYDRIELGKFYYTFRDLPIESKKQKDYIQKMVADPKQARMDGSSMLVPRSFGYYVGKDNQFTQCWGQGAYSVSINIKESSKQNFITKIIQDNSDAISGGIRQIKIK